MDQVRIGDYVGWKWVNGVATGRVISVSNDRTQIESKGKVITRNGSADDPAVTIEQDNGTLVLKLQHELQRVDN